MLVARYTANVSGVVPTFNDGYQYTINEVNSNGIYTVEINSDSDFSSCSFNGKSQLLTVEYLKVTSNVTSMTSMFRSCSSLTKLDLSNWDTKNVITMESMFQGCSKLTQLDVSNFDTSSVTNMNYMFQNCSKLAQLDLSSWDASNVTSMDDMFNNCSQLNKVKLLNTSNNINLINTLPTKTIANVGYLFTKEEYPNDKYWESIIIKEKQVDLILPQPLRRVGDVSDRLYWDREKGCYCIEININEDLTIKEESQTIDLSQYVEPILFYQRESTTVKIAENSPIKPKELTLNYRNIDDK